MKFSDAEILESFGLESWRGGGWVSEGHWVSFDGERVTGGPRKRDRTEYRRANLAKYAAYERKSYRKRRARRKRREATKRYLARVDAKLKAKRKQRHEASSQARGSTR